MKKTYANHMLIHFLCAVLKYYPDIFNAESVEIAEEDSMCSDNRTAID